MALTSETTPRFSVVRLMDKYLIDRLVEPADLDLLCPIRYVYNYLPKNIEWLKPQPVTLPSSERRDSDPCSFGANGIQLRVSQTSLPIHTGLTRFGQTRHWKANIQAGRTLLELFAGDLRCRDIVLGNGQSMASQAAEQLKFPVPDTYGRFSIYMFPNADEKRTQLLAQMIILIFIFDGKSSVYP